MKRKNILQFWRSVEIFDLPDFNNDAILLNEGDMLPWFKKNRLVKKHYKWRYTLLFGKIEKIFIIDHLNSLLKDDNVSDWEEPVQGFSCLSALILDEDGCPEQDSYVTASYSFGINALEKKKDLSSVADELEKSREDYLERYNIPENIPEEGDDKQPEAKKGKPVNWEHLQKERNYLKQLNPWWTGELRFFFLEELVPKDSEPNADFLNSFYLDDLNHLATIKAEELGAALQSYLTLQPQEKERKDLIENKQFLFESFDPKHMTSGRWPSKVEHGLYSAQAGAVNIIFANLRNNEGLQGVNGPPGTGKTTLLLDVIAGIVVERAKVISNLGCDKLFEKGYTKIEKEDGFNQYTYSLVKDLQKNFGIVIASNNNAAVENISKELPLKSKIDGSAFPEAEYFSECSKTIIEKESWGVLAAALGNAKNRNTFRKAFWTSEISNGNIGFNDLLYQVYIDPENDQVQHHREAFERENKNFKSLLGAFDNFKKLAASFHEQLPLFIKNKKEETRINIEVKEITKRLSGLAEEKQIIADKDERIKKDAERAQSLLLLLMQRKPSFFFFQKLFKTNNFKIWNTEAEEMMTNLKSIHAELEELKRQLDKNSKETQQLSSQQNEFRSTLSRLTSFFDGYQKSQVVLSDQYGINPENLFTIEFFQKEIADVHLLNPYHSPEIAKLRSNLFISALQLHRHAILINAKKIRNNLKAYLEMTAGWVKVDTNIAQNLWDTFFLCVPVASTTLASASRLFPNPNKQQIGWLLIDEAGQATPQSAAGLIHRAKRCVIVGDPLQVEPVVTIPKKLVTKLRKEHAVEVDWSPYKVSVQQLADRVSLSGTYMSVGDSEEKIWTGFPLRTHRRCDDPMFSIANQIAYSNQMVKAISTNSTDEFIGASCWFDVSSGPTLINKHVIEEEITLLTQKISDLRNWGYTGEIYVISPFKSVASYCDGQFRFQKNISCGTIHRFQGKEADIVFLILGSDPKSSGARNWASQKPNMLNVALTRAKKRFYVIGNKKLWGSCDYFNTMLKWLK